MVRNEGFKGFPEKIRYSLAKTSIKGLSEVKKLLGEIGKLDWPLELQGRGLTHQDTGSFEIEFPEGDIFLSYITTIHELGHLRQEELNLALANKDNTHAELRAQEEDAWERGWNRFVGANPELLLGLEKKFAKGKDEGKLRAESFAALYQWVRTHALEIVEAQHVLFENAGEADEAATDKLATGLESIGINDFLRDYASFRVGEQVDVREIRSMIKKTVAGVIGE